MELDEFLGKSNEMEFKCKHCGKDIPDIENELADDVVRIETHELHNCTTVWWFCNARCFTEYIQEHIC